VTRERIEMIAVVALILLLGSPYVYRDGAKIIPGMAGILLLSASWGYCIGAAGKRRFWSGKKVKSVALLPLLLVLAFLLVYAVSLAPRGAPLAKSGSPWANPLGLCFMANCRRGSRGQGCWRSATGRLNNKSSWGQSESRLRGDALPAGGRTWGMFTGCGLAESLVPQRLDRIYPRGAQCGHISRHTSGDRQNSDRQPPSRVWLSRP